MILLIGATDFIGRAAARRLRELRFRVRALVPPEVDVSALASLGVDVARGDSREAAALSPALSGVTAVLSAASAMRERRGASFEDVHVLAVRRLVEAARDAGVKRIIHLSTLGARADASTRYARTAFQGEEIVRGSGIDYLVLRLALVVGPEDAFSSRLAAIARRRSFVPLVGGGRARLQPVPVDQVVEAIVYGILQDRFRDQTIDVGGSEPIALRAAIQEIARSAGGCARLFSVPRAVAWPLLALAETILREPPFTREMVACALEDGLCDTTRMRELLGIEPRTFDSTLDHVRSSGS